MRKTTIALAALAAVAFAGTASAQTPLSIEARAGAVIPTGDWADVAKTGFGLHGDLTYNFTPVVGVYGGYTWNRLGVDDALGDGNWTEQGFDVGLKARFASASGIPLTPFFRAGAIIHKLSISDDEGDLTVSGDYKVGFDVGGGVELAVAPKISLIPQVGYSQFSPGDDDDGDSGNVSNVHVGVGLNIRL